MSLLAATSLGMGAVGGFRATVRAAETLVTDESQHMRLIVQSYHKDSLTADLRPRGDARPCASLQRAVTAEEIVRGVRVRVVDLDQGDDDRVVLAWLENGTPTLEYDALEARPAADAYVGVAVDDHAADPQIVLRRG